MAELKPCPFCGSEKLRVNRKSTLAGFNGLDQRVERHTYSVRCNICHARGPAVGGEVMADKSLWDNMLLPMPKWATSDEVIKQRAIDLWNGADAP